jgi:glucokinase
LQDGFEEDAVNNVIGIDIGGTRFRVGLFDAEGRRLLVSEDSTLRSGGRDWMLEQIRERAKVLMHRTDYPVKACGVSFGGPVDFERQQVSSIHAPGWAKFPLAQWVKETLKLPCRVDNDANAGALGEYRFGTGRGTQSIVYITISTGIGSGLVYEGKVLRGKDNLAGELGHIPVSDSGVVCSCGARGCLETFCSGTAIAQRGQDWATRRPERVARIVELSGGRPESVTAAAVVQAAAEGDMAAAQILREVARWLARAILTVIRMLDPDKIVLGGGVAQAGSTLLSPVREYLEDLGSPSINYSTEIVLAELGPYSPLYGAAALALEII